ncbi:uncharacterized protein LOC129916549 [Episyrphus balteatus]|uniref:uncharacterized protein LOC129916549 n=1 Tax=Episyrphus balteatus TaxID=286459 RepID=UPI0024853476|nr:uncharacterized protein LOC129916549 [Episyrphus balteatus]
MKVFSISTIICVFLILAECQYHSQHNPNGPVYDGLDSVLDEAAKNSQMFANDLTQRMNKTFNTIEEKLEQWKNNNAFSNQLEMFETNGNQCVKENEVALAQFMRNLVSTYDLCAKEVKKLVSEKLTAITDSLKFIKNAPRQVENISAECFAQEEKPVDLAVSSLCVVTRIANIELITSEANDLVEKFIHQGVAEIEAFAATNCKGIKELDREFVEIFTKIQACVQNNRQ